LDLRSKVSLWHTFPLWNADVRHRGSRNPRVTDSGPIAKSSQPIYEEAPYYPVDPSIASASGGDHSCLNPYAGSYAPTTMTSWGHPIGVPVSWAPAETSSPTSSSTSTGRDSIEDYPEIMGSVYGNPTIETRHINMVGPTRAPSHNSTSRYPTIKRSKASNAWTPRNRVV
jgi:hypothetical protein